MKVVAVASAKGGVGKTTVTANLASALARQGRTVLVVDLDPQNALGLHFGLAPQEIRGLARCALTQDSWSSAVFRGPDGVYTLPHGLINEDDRLAFEHAIDPQPDWLARHLGGLGLPGHAVVLLDTPPGPSVYMRQALRAAHLALVVSLSDAASYAALPMMQRLLAAYGTPRPEFVDSLYLLNQTDAGHPLSRDVVNLMRSSFGRRLIGVVHQDQAVGEALACDQSVFDYNRHSLAAQDLREAADRLAAWLPPLPPARPT